MASISYTCDVAQGFNAQADTQTIVGFITTLKIGETTFETDLSVTDPEDNEGELKVVGVMSDIYWEGGEADPISMGGRVTTKNKNLAIELVQKKLSDTSVACSFVVYEYDPEAKKYFKCFHTNDADFDALLLKSGGELNLYIDAEQATEVQAPKVFPLNVGIMPPEPTTGQDVHFAASVDSKMVKQWGVKIA